MQLLRAPQQVHRTNQSRKSEVVVAMQVADEDVINSLKFELEFTQLKLRTFSTIHEVEFIVHVQ